ncbi:hypothetical protein D8B26_001075 [Coccidioides posadasii str. Silveira]|uniref:Autophagy-related protein 14 n=2 Tax=Coccidioides posadasii TaxID=199306 RepID=E9CTW6_COCPS|nr:hypothetical protein CPC735_039150 [Coccidioides posadasii C735 delta SOWgp]EER28651.1 hypothetical protein CPC735_039150 [Coccidioides posadasii C735 delta SOWgp]EFW22209.1 conserved hypothetical protein [Coccidioides posadasii str. Silveira]QVM06362.1 hypothetical protein D8B26_001075 [Coccidioides posadasii str. Silveira]|eukprot:XP_003070796.1 hypothetical protein CPC735_039150 [Coccidioides posadasii C735 delta SOWgp]
MICQVCHRPPDSSLPFYCPNCARNRLYPLRFDLAKTLLEKEAAGQKIEKAVKNAAGFKGIAPAGSGQPKSTLDEPSKIAIETMRTLKTQSEIRTEAIQVQIAKLRREIEEGKQEIAKRRAALAKRRSDAEAVNYQLSQRRAAILNNVQKEIKKTENAWNTLHSKTAESRMFLCREVASLYNLRQKTRRRNGEIISTYSIGGVNMVDPRDMNSASPAQITTSLSHIAHLLVLVSHYLALRLPAEVILPHRGYPLPTVFPPGSSYIAKDIPFPGLSPSNSFGPTASKAPDRRPLPRPRPLFLDRSLPKLSKEDPGGYALFVEGVALLAWNVSWVCRSQGLHIGQDSWEDVCEMGRNLWQLLVAPPALTKALAGRDLQAKPPSNKDAPTRGGALHRTRSLPLLGHYSHGTAHSFLGSAEGLEFMKTWKLPSPLKVADKLKSTLLSDMATTEWELLEEDEWDEGGTPQPETEQNDGHVLVATRQARDNDPGNEDTRSILTARTVVDEEYNERARGERGEATASSARPKGTKGWTKVKSR